MPSFSTNASLVRTLTANNPGPFTGSGTTAHIIGRGQVAIIDPGPDEAAHVDALLKAVDGETITHILLTHTHLDHSGAIAQLARITGARIAGCAPASPAASVLDAATDRAYAPDDILTDGDTITGPGWTLEAVATPGHTANHLAFALREEETLFPGDHVMGWATSIVAPPDGDMAAYRASLQKIAGRRERLYRPTHGAPLPDGPARVAELAAHRARREAQILAALTKRPATPEALVPVIYKELPTSMHPAAALSVEAHLIELAARGDIKRDASGREYMRLF